MKNFSNDFLNFHKIPKNEPNFENIIKVLKCEKPDRLTLFEFFLNPKLEFTLTGNDVSYDYLANRISAFKNAGYDYTTIIASDFDFPRNVTQRKKSLSANEGAIITDRESFEKYQWQNPKEKYDGRIEKYEKFLPTGMKFIVHGPNGVLENVINIVGYDNMCYMSIDDPELLGEIFNKVGESLLDYYIIALEYDSVGAIISNDDWGFNSQTMLSTADMRKFVFPWHKKIVAAAHAKGKPCVLHSCGNLEKVYSDISDDMKFDGKHSFEDKILPVEDSYDKYFGDFAIMGGIDIDFIARKTPKEIYKRSCGILEKTNCVGYALGTGNSVPEYIPFDNYLAMISAVIQNR